MFAECEHLTYLNLNNFNTSKIKEMKRVFFSCKSLISLDLTSFNTSQTTSMVSTFYGCEKLISVDLSSFNTTILRNLNGMFRDCKSLTSLNLSHFVAPSINDISFLFQNNYHLEYLDISNLGTINVYHMNESFSNCWSLKTLDLSNFNTSNTKIMSQMFENCKSLIYLNLSNFDTSNVVNMTNMFSNCEKLRYINLKNSKDSGNLITTDIFTNTPEKMIFCIDEIKNKKLYDIIIYNKPNSTINCSDDAYIYIPKTNNEMTIDEFKENILNTITLYVNSSNIINGSDFLAVVLSSDDMDPEKQIKKGISSVDLGECKQIIKQHYNISDNESFIILNIESKNIENKTEKNNNDDNSFYLGKNNQIAIFDNLGRKLDLSVCNKNIKLMKYIGDIDIVDLDIQSAKTLSNKGIDVFNPKDDFFNDICKEVDDINGKDMILNDRRTDYFQNATFCQEGCSYTGINYEIMAANCLCNAHSLKLEENNNEEKNNKQQNEKINFDVIKNNILTSLLDFNYDVMKCYNLVIYQKILKYNIGFYCMSVMFILQLIFLCIF